MIDFVTAGSLQIAGYWDKARYGPSKSVESNAVDRHPCRLASAWLLSSEVGHPGSRTNRCDVD